jgi:biotin/methionine sulfoxide reductase
MTDLLHHAAHWGAFSGIVQDGRLRGVVPPVDDPAPPAILQGMADAVHSPLRIDRPHVRKGWLRGDRGGGTPRGGEPFVPVSWDTAVRLVAGEVARVRDMHGPASIFGGSYGWASAGRFHHAQSQLHRLLAAAGGYTGQVTNYSYAAGMTLMPHIVGGMEIVDRPVVAWRDIVAHAKVLVCFGGITLRNGQVNAGGGARHEMGVWLRRAAEAGIRIVNVSPIRADMPADVPCEWWPIRPGTDVALMLALAHTLIAEGRVDHDFLARCTTGHDRLRDYITGISDGLAKTPDWAAGETGLPAADISALAHDLAARPHMMTAAWSLQRAEAGEQPYWMLTALAAMLGRVGLPGQGFAFGLGSENGMGGARVMVPSVHLPALPNPARSYIPVARITDMLERPGDVVDWNGRRITYPDTRLVWWAGGNPFHHHQDINRLLRAWARPETIVVSEPWWTPVARHADIVLPATTTMERNDIGSGSLDRFILAMKRLVPPQGQARDEFDYMGDIADALGVRPRFTQQRNVDAWLRAMYDRARDAYARMDVAIPDFDRFWAEGMVEVPEPERPFVAFRAFRTDPEAAKLNTPSGKIEIFSERIAGFGYDDCPGHPVWRRPVEYLGTARPGQLHLLSVQPATRLHSQMDMARLSQAAKVQGREAMLIHRDDAAARGIAEGDVVRVFNARGACLAGAVLTDGLLRGVAVLPTGAWYDPLEPGVPGSLCVHGNPNVLTRDVGTSRLGQGPVAQSCLVEIERFDGRLPPVKVHQPPPIEAAEAGDPT